MEGSTLRSMSCLPQQRVPHWSLHPAFHNGGFHIEVCILPSTMEGSTLRSASCLPQQRVPHWGLHPAFHNGGFHIEVCILPSTMEGSALRSASCLPQWRVPHWGLHPAFHNNFTTTHWTGGMHNDPSLIPAFKWIQFASFDSSWYICIFGHYYYYQSSIEQAPLLFGTHWFFTLLLAHGTNIITIIANMVAILLAFLCRTVIFWLAEIVWVIDSPEPSMVLHLKYRSEAPKFQLR